MKRIFHSIPAVFSTILLLFLSFNLDAQIDRSKQPKAGPAPKINLKKPKTFTLDNGLKVLVVEDNKLPKMSMSLSLDNEPVALGDLAGLDDVVGAMLGKGSQKTAKDVFEEEIDFIGATMELYGSGGYASGLSRYTDKLMSMMAEAALLPNFTQEELDKERNKIIEGLKTEEKSAGSIASRVRNVLVYGKNHPFGEFVTEESLNRITLADVQKYYETYFVPGKAYMIVTGDVKFNEVKQKVTQYFGTWKKAMPPKANMPAIKNVDKTQIDFVDVPNAVQAEVSFVNTVELRMTDPDYFPVLIANEIVGGSFESYLNKTLREEKAWTYGARSSLSASKYTTTFRAGAPLKQAVLDSAVLEILTQINRIRTNPVTQDELDLAIATFVGDFIRESAKPRSVSGFALRIETQGLPANFYEKYLENISKVSIKDVQRVANKYFLTNQARIVIAAKGSEVADKIENIGLPVFYYDRFGNPTEKPKAAVLDASVTKEMVLNNYINSIGGAAKLNEIKTIKKEGSAAFPGAPMPISVEMANMKGYSLMKMSMGGMVLAKTIVNPQNAYISQQGQRKDMEGDELKEANEQAAELFVELAMLNDREVILVGIENIDGADAYVLQKGDKKYFYDVKTGLKIAVSTDFDRDGQAGTTFTYFKDYQALNGVLFPYNIIQDLGNGMKLDIEITEILINEDVSDEDFE
jgi:predicted Zn-dependent peptidase